MTTTTLHDTTYKQGEEVAPAGYPGWLHFGLYWHKQGQGRNQNI